jgi:hypothetical protein
MNNGEVAVIKLRHHEKGPWLRKWRAEEEKSEDAPHLVERERVKLEAEAKMTLQKELSSLVLRLIAYQIKSS